MVRSLLSENEILSEELTRRGQFDSTDDAVHEALLLLDQKIRLAELNELVREGLDQLDAGQAISVDDPHVMLEESLKQARILREKGVTPAPHTIP